MSSEKTIAPIAVVKAYRSLYVRLLRYLRPYRKRFVLALLAMACYGATDGAVPFILRRVLDDIFKDNNQEMLYILVGATFAFGIIRGFFGFFQAYLPATVGLRIIADLRNDISQHLLRLSPAFFSRHSTGSLLSRMTNDTLLVRAALTDALATMLRDSVRIVSLVAAAIILDPKLAAIALIGFPLAAYPVLKFGRKVRRFSRVGQDIFGGLSSVLQENIVGQRVVQAFSMEDFEQRRFEAENRRLLHTFEKAEKYGAFSSPTNEVLACTIVALVILYGGLSVIKGARTPGDFVAFVTSVLLLYEPMKKMGRVNFTIQAGLSAAERIFEVLDEEPEIQESASAVALTVSRPRVEYRNVTFRYGRSEGAPENEDALRDVTLVIEPGETVALVGMSGGGKSTLVNLLPRLYDPSEGSILIDGTDIRDLTLSSLRRNISVVAQHTFLFNDTVLHNIRYGRMEASEDEVYEAARSANAHRFIERLPQGFNTVIGEQGLRLSGGERARIAIARALLKNAPILILDEATASLDSESEELVREAIELLMEGRTVLVIAHRLSTIRSADRIAVMRHGEVVELGTHETLLVRAGEYAKLYNLQYRGEETQQRAEGLA